MFSEVGHTCTVLAVTSSGAQALPASHSGHFTTTVMQEVQDSQPDVIAFADDANRTWEVHEIRTPILTERRGQYVRPEFAEGWLLFMSGTERRRFAPLPPGWRLADEKQLKRWVEVAMPVTSS